MLETAKFIFDNGDNLSVNVIMCLVGVYALWRVHKIELKHDEEFRIIRKEHRDEREQIQAHTNAALDKIALEIAAANKERQEIKELVKSVVGFNDTTQRALYDYDLILNQIAAKLDVNARCDINFKKLREKRQERQTDLTNWAVGE